MVVAQSYYLCYMQGGTSNIAYNPTASATGSAVTMTSSTLQSPLSVPSVLTVPPAQSHAFNTCGFHQQPPVNGTPFRPTLAPFQSNAFRQIRSHYPGISSTAYPSQPMTTPLNAQISKVQGTHSILMKSQQINGTLKRKADDSTATTCTLTSAVSTSLDGNNNSSNSKAAAASQSAVQYATTPFYGYTQAHQATGFYQQNLNGFKPATTTTTTTSSHFQPLYCKTCRVTLNAPAQAQQHYKGKTHAKRLKLMTDPPKRQRNRETSSKTPDDDKMDSSEDRAEGEEHKPRDERTRGATYDGTSTPDSVSSSVFSSSSETSTSPTSSTLIELTARTDHSPAVDTVGGAPGSSEHEPSIEANDIEVPDAATSGSQTGSNCVLNESPDGYEDITKTNDADEDAEVMTSQRVDGNDVDEAEDSTIRRSVDEETKQLEPPPAKSPRCDSPSVGQTPAGDTSNEVADASAPSASNETKDGKACGPEVKDRAKYRAARANPGKAENDPEVYCKICAVSFNSPKQAQQHYHGKNHAKKIRSVHGGNRTIVIDKGSSKFFCRACREQLTSEEELERHLNSTSHSMQVKVQERLGLFSRGRWYNKGAFNGMRTNIPPFVANQMAVATATASLATNQQALLFPTVKSFAAPLLPAAPTATSLDLYRATSGQYYCATCNVAMTTYAHYMQHLESQQHKLYQNAGLGATPPYLSNQVTDALNVIPQ